MDGAPENRLTRLQTKDAGMGRNARAVLRYGPALAAGLALRLWMLTRLFHVSGDSYIYGGLAKNLLLHGAYAIRRSNGLLTPTLIRLPGYPIFVAACFRLFGMDRYAPVIFVQIALDLASCLLLADFVRRIAPSGIANRAAMATLWLAALCPFTADYSTAVLTETPTLFAIALAMWTMARFREKPGWACGLWFTFAVVFAAMLRPDGALVAVTFAPALLLGLPAGMVSRTRLTRLGATCLLLALLPFAAWTCRNWSIFHVFQPLAPRYANDPWEPTYPGWNRWVKTWSLDWISTDQVYWNVPDDPLNMDDLPDRAFDSPAQRRTTAALFAAYQDADKNLTPTLDAQFGRLAAERIRSHPVRYYLWLPLGRLADMILRPRIENLPIDPDWWNYSHHPFETSFSWAYGALNILYLLLAIAGLCLRPRLWKPLLAYLVLRCLLLLNIGAPEDRYTLEFFPILFAWGGIAVAAAAQRFLPAKAVGQTAADAGGAA